MGKNSLIKSTEKKKAKPKKEETTKKTTASKSKAKSTTTAKKTAQKSSSSTAKTAAKKNPRKAPAKKAAAKVNVKELIFKKFEPLSKQPVPSTAVKASGDIPPAPPLIATDDPKEAERLRALLRARFSMADIKAAAKAPKPKASEPKPSESKAPEPLAPEPKTPEPEAEASPPTPPEKEEKVEEEKAKAEAPVSGPVKDAGPVPSVSYTPPPDNGPSFGGDGSEPDPVKRVIKFGAIALAVLLLLLVGASYKNSNKYFIEDKGDAIEIWRGRFSPTGKERIILLHGVTAPPNTHTVYSRNHVFPLAFDYYLEKADSLLDVQGVPDYDAIKEYLHKAEQFAINSDMQGNITARLNAIDLTALLYKIDVALRRDTSESLAQAAELAEEADDLILSPSQNQLVNQKMAEIEQRRAALKAAPAPQADPQADIDQKTGPAATQENAPPETD